MGKIFFIAILLVTNCIPGLTQNLSAETNGKTDLAAWHDHLAE
jgi:hypothetical protein